VGSDFYIKKKSDTEVSVMYHDLEYGSNPFELEYGDYDEILVINIEKDIEIQIEEMIVLEK